MRYADRKKETTTRSDLGNWLTGLCSVRVRIILWQLRIFVETWAVVIIIVSKHTKKISSWYKNFGWQMWIRYYSIIFEHVKSCARRSGCGWCGIICWPTSWQLFQLNNMLRTVFIYILLLFLSRFASSFFVCRTINQHAVCERHSNAMFAGVMHSIAQCFISWKKIETENCCCFLYLFTADPATGADLANWTKNHSLTYCLFMPLIGYSTPSSIRSDAKYENYGGKNRIKL